MARVHVVTAPTPHRVEITARTHRFAVDEPADNGGADTAPAPYDLILGGLGACTAITLKMYAERKGWKLDGVAIDLTHRKDDKRSKIERSIQLFGELDEEQRARLADIAERTPVTLTLKEGADIATVFEPA